MRKADCDSESSNGCEVSLGSVSYCNGCDQACGSNEICTQDGEDFSCVCPEDGYIECGGACVVLGVWPNCENCDDCGANATCSGTDNACECTGDYQDCANGLAADGCETLRLNDDHCGSCGNDCGDDTCYFDGSSNYDCAADCDAVCETVVSF